MSSNGMTKEGFDTIVQPFVDFWSGYVKQANEATRELLEGLDDTANVKTLQRRWFDAVSQSLDAYMRSPMFLQAMKQNTDTMVKAKQQVNDLAAEFARNADIPTASDISGLFERLHSVEDVILNRLGRIEQRLQAIEEQIAAGEQVGA